MKFLIVTCIKEYQELVFKIFSQAGIRAYSTTDIVGFKDQQNSNMLEDWFASGDEQFDSCMLFSFTTEINANKAMELVLQYNQNNHTNFPLRAFIVAVEKSSF
ncbi:MAG: hypothetical protein K2Q21_04495 [Chitinophagaceae bacterium]|nr:hypothetical protein [Chitinophagaceae bacterium]